jgi:hypothetical protein
MVKNLGAPTHRNAVVRLMANSMPSMTEMVIAALMQWGVRQRIAMIVSATWRIETKNHMPGENQSA